MDTRFKTTFMPKQPVVAAPQQRRKQSGIGAGLIGIISSVIFVLALLLTAGFFLYEHFLTRRVASLETTLAEAREAFEPAVIEELKRADARMRAAAALLAGHRAETPLFRLLEDETLRSVRYTLFAYTAAGGPGGKLKMSGEARGFRAIALQADALGNHPEVINPVFSDLDQNVENGFATFDFEAQLGKKLTDYGALVEADGGDAAGQ